MNKGNLLCSFLNQDFQDKTIWDSINSTSFRCDNFFDRKSIKWGGQCSYIVPESCAHRNLGVGEPDVLGCYTEFPEFIQFELQ